VGAADQNLCSRSGERHPTDGVCHKMWLTRFYRCCASTLVTVYEDRQGIVWTSPSTPRRQCIPPMGSCLTAAVAPPRQVKRKTLEPVWGEIFILDYDRSIRHATVEVGSALVFLPSAFTSFVAAGTFTDSPSSTGLTLSHQHVYRPLFRVWWR
jgi:hypothetical protein